jgi:hypothetical protein
VKYVDPDGNAFVIPAIVAIVLKSAAIGAAVSGVIDIAKQALSSIGSSGGVNLDLKQTAAAMAGGAVAGAITGGAGVGASLLEPVAAKAVVAAGGAVAGGTGSATTTVIDNASHGRPLSNNLVENTVVGTVAGTISGTTAKAPSVSYNAPTSYNPITVQSFVREAGKEILNGVKDDFITRGTQEVLY